MRKKISSSSTRRKRVRGGAVMTRRSSSPRSSSRRSMGHHLSSSRRSMGRRSASASMSKKMLSVSKYVTILNKLVKSKAIKKDDLVAGYLLVPFVDSYSDTTKYSRSSQSGQRIVTVRGGAGPARAASIADEPESQRLQEQDLIDLLTRHGRAVLGLHGPCWWHRINHYERLLSMRRCNPERGESQLRRNAVIDFLCRLQLKAPGSRPRAEACMQAADDNQDLALRYLQEGIPETARAAAASRPPRVALTLPPECVGQVYISPGARFEYTNPPGELARAMDYFAAQYQSYCPLVHTPVPVGLTGAELTRIVLKALGDASGRLPPPTTEQFRVPAHFDSPATRLTFCEYAAIFFFTRINGSQFSSYLLLNNTMNYSSVKDLAAAEYVQIIRHPFVMLFYFALYKCPRIRDIRQQAGLIPPGMRHLHRFMLVNAGVFQTYRSLPVADLVTFYCFQSFSFTLAYQNIVPFTNYDQDREYLILLRLEITDATSARLMSHFSEVIEENEAIVTPCVPYTVVDVQEFQASAGFEQEITAGSGYTHPLPFDALIRGFLVVTIREEKYRESMTGLVRALRG